MDLLSDPQNDLIRKAAEGLKLIQQKQQGGLGAEPEKKPGKVASLVPYGEEDEVYL